MQTARHTHSAIFYNNHIVVTGGYGDNGITYGDSYPTEKCKLANDQVTCKSTTPNLANYWNPETFIVPFDFCQ